MMIYILCVIYFILNIIDYYFTNIILKNNGYEINPIIRFFQSSRKYDWIIFKLLNTIMVIILVLYIHTIDYYLSLIIILILNFVYLFAVLFNYNQIIKQREDK